MKFERNSGQICGGAARVEYLKENGRIMRAAL